METKSENTKIIADGICKVNSVYIITEEIYNDFVEYKKECIKYRMKLRSIKQILDKE